MYKILNTTSCKGAADQMQHDSVDVLFCKRPQYQAPKSPKETKNCETTQMHISTDSLLQVPNCTYPPRTFAFLPLSTKITVIPLQMNFVDAEDPKKSQIHTTVYFERQSHVFQFCSVCLAVACMSIIFVSRFLLLRELFFTLVVRIFVECFTMRSSTPVSTFPSDGSSGGASGHGVRFDGTVISKGGSMVHLYKTKFKLITQMDCRINMMKS